MKAKQLRLTFIEPEEVDSTNAFAKQLLSNVNPAEGTIVLTRNQHSGRGQRNTRWYFSRNDSLAASIILYPEFLVPDQQFRLNQIVTLAIAEYMEKVAGIAGVKIKWPNDIYIDHRKLCGILIENVISSKKINSSIVGIGINLNQDEFPVTLPNPVSLKQKTGRRYHAHSVITAIHDYLDGWYQKLYEGSIAFINKEYSERLYLINQKEIFTWNNHQAEGIIRGVTKEGYLILEVNGNKEYFNFKEIKFPELWP